MPAKHAAYCIANREGTEFWTGEIREDDGGQWLDTSSVIHRADIFYSLVDLQEALELIPPNLRSELVPCQLLTKLLWKARK